MQIYRPKHIKPPYPTLFYVPGTAFVAREIAFTEMICTHLADNSKSQVIVINHCLAPEDKFPRGLDDTYNVLKFSIRELESSFHIDKSKIAIIGYSSGGNFAASMVIQSKEDGLPIARQILISPLVDLSRSLQDFKTNFENKDTAITETFVEWFLNLYLPEGVNLNNPWLSPFWNKPTSFQGLPPTDIIVAEYDRFRSDSQAYYEKLVEAGVDTYSSVVSGEDHSFLWHRLEVVEAIGNRIKIAFEPHPIPKPIANYKHSLPFFRSKITLHAKCNEEPTNKEIIVRNVLK